jgi:hypothetical protein
VDDFRCRDADGFAAQSGIGDVAGVAAQEVVGDPAPQPVELDALADQVAARQNLVAGQRQHFRRDHLQLQRRRQPVGRTTGAEAEEHLPGHEHFAGGAALLTVEVGEACGDFLSAPAAPPSPALGSSVHSSHSRWTAALTVGSAINGP